MALAGQGMTAEEYFVATDGDPRTQLIDGVVVVNEPSLRHQRIIGWLHARLLVWSEAAPGRGEPGLPADVRLDDRNVFAPDLWWVPDDDRLGRDALRFEAVPAIVVEVRSPSTWSYDRGVKLRRYERDGAREVWLVDTASDTVFVHRRSAGAATFDEVVELGAGDPLTSPLLPDFAVDVRDLFDR